MMLRKLSKIPGSLQTNLKAKAVKLEDFAAFHNLPEDLKKKHIESFRFANSVFPFYIPAEHHDTKLSELQNSKGEYWGTAAHFLLCNKAHGIPLWKTFEAQIQSSDTTITCRPHISTNMTNRILQHIPSNDDGDLNFVFQNWVLLQLPFQPILLFQWLTYAVYHLSSIEILMAKLYYVPFPEKFKPVSLCLHKKLKLAHRNIGFLFDYLQHQIRCPHLKIFGDSNEELVRKRETEVTLQDRNAHTNLILKRDFVPDDTMKIKINSISQTDDDEFLKIQRKINQLSEIFPSIYIEKEDSGIIGPVLSSNVAVEYCYTISEFQAWMFKKYKVLPKRDPHSRDNLSEFAIENIIPLFEKMKKYKHPFLKLVNNLKRYNQPNQEFECSSRFEARIRNIVLDCIESHLRVQNFEEKKNEVLRDWHVVQYLLPCFVALYVKICESNDPEHKNLQNWYAQFLDKLICTYEEDGIRKSSWSNVLQDIVNNHALKGSCLNNNHEKLLNLFTEVADIFVKRIMRGASKDAKAVNIEDFDVFHNNLPEDLKKKQNESLRFANSVFPFYIPDEHHEINLSQQQNSKGEYWGTAAHFLLCNKAHGIPLWKTFEAQIQSSGTTFTCRPHISTNMTNRILQHIPSNDGGDLNFVFQYWVLVQLPFQPILLFQWLTFAVYHLSKIEKRMAKLYYVPFPEKLKPELLCLHKMLKTAHRNIGFLFDYLQHQTRSEPDIFVGNLKVFEEILQEARIRTIVLDCIESHLRLQNFQNFEEKKNEVLRDWHVVQYLLPCFVALYVKICESNDPRHKNLQNWYAQFLDKLICTYEEDGIRKSSWSNVLQDINSFPPLRESCLNNNHEDLSNFFTEVSNHFVGRIMRGASKDARNHLYCCRFFRAFYEVIQKNSGDLDENDVVATEASAYWNWLMWDFFSRMKQALEVAE
ncbi:Hypothetical predicted protein [Cloeon dipterum]|uniref:Uncharacterized protein n=1 Tax=Cloeon dipterum TaxID=197152 RepID=A0A8S1CZR0_9INSE|nr:Hypothetical predicted protein [Cloeon dipterum]